MKGIVLAAGYATRLYPLTLNQPKPLLEVGGRPILAYLLDALAPVASLDRLYVVTNSKFADRFRAWAAELDPPREELRPAVIDDGTTDDANKLGAIGDLELVIRREQLADDVLVAAGDSIFTESLEGLARFGLARQAPVIGVYDVGDLELIKRYSAITTDAEGRITAFEEKPEHPQSTITGIALYFYPRSVLPLIRQYVEDGNNADQPGRLVQWLYPRLRFYTWRVPGRWYDIGSKETLAEADREFSQAARS